MSSPENRAQLRSLVEQIELSCFLVCDAARVYENTLAIFGGGWDVQYAYGRFPAFIRAAFALMGKAPNDLESVTLQGSVDLIAHSDADGKVKDVPQSIQQIGFSWLIGAIATEPEIRAMQPNAFDVVSAVEGFNLVVHYPGVYELRFAVENRVLGESYFVVREGGRDQ